MKHPGCGYCRCVEGRIEVNSLEHFVAPSNVEGSVRGIVAETPRLLLRQLESADLAFLVRLFGSLEVMRFSLTGPLAPVQVREILGRFLQSYSTQPLAQWGVVEKATGELIGLCGFLAPRIDAESGWELAYRFLPHAWNHGLGTEAASACREIAFRTPGVDRIIALIEPAQVASIRVVEKTGLKLHSTVSINGLPALKYALTRAI